MATASAKATTAEHWTARAIELAEQHHLTGTARLVDGVYIVPSRDRKGSHVVEILNSRASCDCVAGSYGRACSHAGAALHAEAQRQRAHDDPFRTFATTGEW